MNTSTYDDAVMQCAAFLNAADTFRVVGIDGRSGSGKTSICAEILEQTSLCSVLHLDDVYQGWEGLTAGIDIARDALQRLAHGDCATVRPFAWLGADTRDDLVLKPGPLIIEGVGATAAISSFNLTLTVWLQASHDTRKHRALARDGAVFAEHWETWKRQENLLFRENYPHAQLYVEKF